jgi:hypothetical protein
VVAAGSLLVVAADVVQAPNDKQQLEPMLDQIAELPEALGEVGELLADNGYFSEGNVNACAAAGIDPVIAMGREAHHPSLEERFAEAPPPPQDPTPLAAMGHRLKTPEGKQRYAPRLRKGRLAEADAGTSVRHHQVGAWLPSVSAPRPR